MGLFNPSFNMLFGFGFGGEIGYLVVDPFQYTKYEYICFCKENMHSGHEFDACLYGTRLLYVTKLR